MNLTRVGRCWAMCWWNEWVSPRARSLSWPAPRTLLGDGKWYVCMNYLMIYIGRIIIRQEKINANPPSQADRTPNCFKMCFSLLLVLLLWSCSVIWNLNIRCFNKYKRNEGASHNLSLKDIKEALNHWREILCPWMRLYRCTDVSSRKQSIILIQDGSNENPESTFGYLDNGF